MTLLIMAAGNGSRYGKLKQFDELGPSSEFLMEFSIYDAVKHGFKHIVIITKKENKSFLFNYIRSRIKKTIKLDVIIQENSNLPNEVNANYNRTKPWGTAHAVWCAKDYINGDFAIINADDYYGAKAYKNASKFFNHSNNPNEYGLIAYKLKNTLSKYGSVSRGVCKEKNNKLLSINEFLKIEKINNEIKDHDSNTIFDSDDYVSMNFWLCKYNFFKHLESYIVKQIDNLNNIETDEIYLPFAAQQLLSKQIISVNLIDSESSWFGVTYKEDKLNSIKNLQLYSSDGVYPTPLWKV